VTFQADQSLSSRFAASQLRQTEESGVDGIHRRSIRRTCALGSRRRRHSLLSAAITTRFRCYGYGRVGGRPDGDGLTADATKNPSALPTWAAGSPTAGSAPVPPPACSRMFSSIESMAPSKPSRNRARSHAHYLRLLRGGTSSLGPTASAMICPAPRAKPSSSSIVAGCGVDDGLSASRVSVDRFPFFFFSTVGGLPTKNSKLRGERCDSAEA
jgi:hypothetical protein